jgi:putative transposase
VLDRRAYDNHVVLYFSRLGRTTENTFIESFNGNLRDRCLNIHWFMSLEDTRKGLKIGDRITIFKAHSSTGIARQ